MAAKSRGWKVLGMEPDDKARKICDVAALETMPPSAINAIPDTSADAITLWHALEHIHDFRETLRQCKRILKPNGILVIKVPNIASPEAAWYGGGWAGLDVPIHLHHFTPDTMRVAFKNAGFDLTVMRATWTDARRTKR